MPPMTPFDGGMRWENGLWAAQQWGLSWIFLVIMLLVRLQAKVPGSGVEGRAITVAVGGPPLWQGLAGGL